MRSVDEQIEVAAPIADVWARWAEVERLPEFMEGIESVRRTDDDRLEWAARLDGEVLRWTSRITRWEPEALIAWTSEDGTEDVGGRVELSEAGREDRTRVHVVIDWPSADMVEVSLDRLRGLVEGSPAGADRDAGAAEGAGAEPRRLAADEPQADGAAGAAEARTPGMGS